ncbi:thioesterase [Christiangramia fulva]|uniref:Thioesterase n=1 Tax=Christiangramia fulva TaxID=2126553 RepID=A0A2R3Z6E4_9FLAO|nr:acyl-CoA thioesterase [Christiangramia fulva]AVR45839.1 thioesterase [Christiangramia fulva]
MEINPEIFEKRIRVRRKHLDKQKHVNNVQFVQWIQDVAEEHWESRAPKEYKDKFFWVVIRHEIDYRKEALLREELLLQTYVGETTNATSVRHVIIKRVSDKKVLVEAKTTWCLINSETKRPARITDDLKRIFLK